MTLNINSHTKKSFLDNSVGKIYTSNCCKISTENNAKALVLPHAGFFYVRQVMDYSFGLIDKRDFKRVLLLTTNHRDDKNYALQASEILYDGDLKIRVLRVESKALEARQDIFHKEHSFLSVLPYLNELRLPVSILVIGRYDVELIEDIMREMDEHTLLVANTDLLHCGATFGTKCPPGVEAYNRETVKKIIENDFTGMRGRVCGRAAVESFGEIVKRLNYSYTEYCVSSSDFGSKSSDFGSKSSDFGSNRATGDDATSVGYCSILYNRSGRANMENNKILSNLPEDVLTQKIKFNFSLHIRKIVGLFVTIKKNGILRGCIGTFKLDGKDLLKGIEKYTFLAAFHDERFNPVQEAELHLLTYSITFLKKPIVVALENLFACFVVGLHGITIYFEDGRSATYLATVITEHFNVKTSQDFENKFRKIEKSLQKKAHSHSGIKKVEIYKCIEI